MLKNIKKYIVSAIIITALCMFIFGFSAQASILSITKPFGGRIVAIIPPNPFTGCFMPQIVVGPPNPGVFTLVPGMKVFEFYQIYRPGAWVLGLAGPNTFICGSPVLMVGTSAF